MTIQTVAGRYALVREIGRGGAGAVWLARDEVLGRDVAVKRIGLPPGAEEADLIRAEREARLAARVIHPNVVAVFDFVEHQEQQWLVMEYVAGTDLARWVRDHGPLPPAEAARVVAKVGRALAAAHELGIVHRDVKPSNILVADDGTVKLSDFGIARGVADASLTQTGLVTGSPAFLAPEVATGGSATAASDVWALGATLFHTLDGRPPYDSGSDSASILATMYRIAHEEPPRLTTEPWLASALEATMTRDPRSRPSAREVADYLASHAASETASTPAAADEHETQLLPLTAEHLPIAPMAVPAPPAAPAPDLARTGSRRDPRRLLAMGAAAVVVLALLGASLLWLGRSGDDADPSASAAASESETRASQSASSDPAESAPATPTAAELEDFARTYVETASDDPAAGFRMLTPEYQAASPRYRDFWGSINNPRITRIEADPANLRVSYTYRYTLKGVGKRTEDVVLQLVQRGDRLLISGGF